MTSNELPGSRSNVAGKSALPSGRPRSVPIGCGLPSDIAKRGPTMRAVEHARVEAILPEISRQPFLDMHPTREVGQGEANAPVVVSWKNRFTVISTLGDVPATPRNYPGPTDH